MAQLALDYAQMDDPGLVSAAQHGYREAFRAIMQRHNQRLFRVARAVVGADEEAEDVLQEAYLRAFAGIGAFRGASALATWLTAIVLNEARGRLRKRKPLVDIETVAESSARIVPLNPHAYTPDPEAEAGRAEAGRLLEGAIDALPADFRLVFVLREIEGLSVEETSTELGLNPATVKTRLHRARRLLRADLEARISAGISGVFPFLGARCTRIAERVLARLA